MMNQEWIALGIVAIAFVSLWVGLYRRQIAGPLSRLLLKRGRVGMAMKVRAQASEDEAGCGNCED